jgi:hypothetical protein
MAMEINQNKNGKFFFLSKEYGDAKKDCGCCNVVG